MRAVVIGAGRGQRLMPTTADAPKCFAEVQGTRILDSVLSAFRAAAVRDICFIGGYQIDKVRAAYPQLTFRHNSGWQSNNILASLMYAEDLMDQPFICCYSDTLFTSAVIDAAVASTGDISLVTDTAWLDRYQHRTEHPPDDAEKVIVADGIVTRVHRDIDADRAAGEFIGVARFSAAGAALLREHYHRRRREFAGKPYREAPTFERAYLIHLLQDMIESGVRIHAVPTAGQYMEIDTQQDFELAQHQWQEQN